MEAIYWDTFSIRIFAAILAGALIGLERQAQHKEAGLKTNTLVALGASVYVLISVHLMEQVDIDLSRIIGQIVVGIGFLGAGVIIREGMNVKGLNTAATLWCTAGLGCLAGLGYMIELLIATVAVLFVNILFRYVEKRFFSPKKFG